MVRMKRMIESDETISVEVTRLRPSVTSEDLISPALPGG
jgi:hypothetical protein